MIAQEQPYIIIPISQEMQYLMINSGDAEANAEYNDAEDDDHNDYLDYGTL